MLLNYLCSSIIQGIKSQDQDAHNAEESRPKLKKLQTRRQKKNATIAANPVEMDQTHAEPQAPTEPVQKKTIGQRHSANSELATKKRKQWIP